MRVIKNSLLYAALTFIRKGIGFLLLPVYTSYLSASDYGTVSVVNSITTFLALFYGLSLHGAASRYYHKYKNDEERQRTLWGTSFLFVAINTLILSLVVILFHSVIIQPFARGIDFNPFILLGLISVAFLPLYNFLQNRLQAEQKGERFALNNLFFFLTNLSFTLFFLVVLHWKAEAVLASIAITNCIFAIYSIIYFWRKINWRIDPVLLKQCLIYSLPLIPHHLSGWLISMIDKLFLNNLKSTATVGIYNVGYQFANIVHTISDSVNKAYKHWFYQEMENGERGREKIRSFALFLSAMYSWLGLAISLFSVDLLRIMVSKEFQESWKVIPFLSSSYVFNGFYFLTINTLFLGKTFLVPFVTITSGILNVVFNALLIPEYGIIGAGTASLIANLLSFSVSLVLSWYSEKMTFPWLRMAAFGIISFLISLMVFKMSAFSWVVSLLLKLLVFSLFSVCIYVLFRKRINPRLQRGIRTFLKRHGGPN